MTQNQGTMAEAARHLWRSSSPTPHSSRGSYGRLSRTASRQGLSTSKHGEAAAPLGNLS